MNKQFCPQCKNELKEVRRFFSSYRRDANRRPLPGRVGYQAWCKKCALPYKRFTMGKEKDTGWMVVEAKPKKKEVNKELIPQIERLFVEYDDLKDEWTDFKNKIETNDKIYLYEYPNVKFQGICLMRAEKILLEVKIQSYFYRKIKALSKA